MTDGVQEYLKGWDDLRKKNNPSLGTKKLTVEEIIPLYFSENERTSLLQRFITVEEVSDTVLFVCANEAVTGNAQKIEGGIIRSI